MSNLTDPEKLKNVIEALGETANSLSIKLGYNSPQTVYFVLNGTNSFSTGMRDRILERFPQVNANFLTDGILPVILTGPELQAQVNLLSGRGDIPQKFINLQDFINLPGALARIEEKLSAICDHLKININ